MENKFHNRKVEIDGEKFDSRLEAKRWLFLKDAEQRGEIRNLKRQVEYELIPKQVRSKFTRLKTKWKETSEVVERPCSYICDFEYEKWGEVYGWRDFERTDYGIVARGWVKVVEDTKGEGRRGRFSTQRPDFRVKKKLMLAVHHIAIRIVTKCDEKI